MLHDTVGFELSQLVQMKSKFARKVGATFRRRPEAFDEREHADHFGTKPGVKAGDGSTHGMPHQVQSIWRQQFEKGVQIGQIVRKVIIAAEWGVARTAVPTRIWRNEVIALLGNALGHKGPSGPLI